MGVRPKSVHVQAYFSMTVFSGNIDGYVFLAISMYYCYLKTKFQKNLKILSNSRFIGNYTTASLDGWTCGVWRCWSYLRCCCFMQCLRCCIVQRMKFCGDEGGRPNFSHWAEFLPFRYWDRNYLIIKKYLKRS